MSHSAKRVTFASLANLLTIVYPWAGAFSFIAAELFDLLPDAEEKQALNSLRKNLQTKLRHALEHYLTENVPDDAEAAELWQATFAFIEAFPLHEKAWLECQSGEEAAEKVFALPDAEASLVQSVAQPERAAKVKELVRICYREVYKERDHLRGLEERLRPFFAENYALLAEKIDKLDDKFEHHLPYLIQRAQKVLERVHALHLIAVRQDPYNKEKHASSRLLMARSSHAVPFYGRSREQQELKEWCNDASAVSIRIYAAAGGTGKTRLFLHMCQLLKKGDAAQRWQTGIINQNDIEDLGKLAPILFQLPQPLFLVIDYAERRAKQQLAALLKQLYTSDTNGQCLSKIRLVLLVRDLSEDITKSDWWKMLEQSDAHDVLDYYDIQSHQLAPFRLQQHGTAQHSNEPSETRRGFLQHALEHFASVLEQPLPQTLPDDAVLSQDYLGQPLYLQILALQLLDNDASLAKSGNELLHFVIKKEHRLLSQRCHALLQADYVAGLKHALIVFTSTQGIDAIDDALELLAEIPYLPESEKARVDIAMFLHEMYGSQQFIKVMLPDLVIEELYGSMMEARFTKKTRSKLLALLLDDTSAYTNPEQVIQHLAALAYRNHEPKAAKQPYKTLLHEALTGRLKPLAQASMAAAVTTGDPIGQVMADIFSEAPDTELALHIVDIIPKETTTLRRFAVEITQTAKDFYVAKGDSVNTAAYANNLSVRLSAIGKREAALSIIEEAVAIYRKLAEARPDAFMPDLAASLNTLSNSQRDLGKREAALSIIEEAVAIYRKLAEARPDAFMPDLAASLNNLSVYQSDVGKREGALRSVEEAVAIYRKLAEARPDAFMPNLAMLLNNLSRCQSDVGKREAALRSIEESVAIYRRLAEARPDAFMPDLAMSLNILSNSQSNLGKREAALGSVEESVAIYRKLAEARPDAFMPDLAMSLNNLSNRQSDLGKREVALGSVEEAVAIYRKLAGARPDAFMPDLARSLNNLSICLSNVEHYENAVEVTQGALAIRRTLAKQNPNAFSIDLAQSLYTCSQQFSHLGNHRQALIHIQEALSTLAPFFKQYPASLMQPAQWLFKHYISCCEALGQEPDASLLAPFADLAP